MNPPTLRPHRLNEPLTVGASYLCRSGAYWELWHAVTERFLMSNGRERPADSPLFHLVFQIVEDKDA